MQIFFAPYSDKKIYLLIVDSWLMLRMVIISQTIFVLRFTLDFKLLLLIVIISILSINSSHKSLLSSLWKLSKFLNKLFG